MSGWDQHYGGFDANQYQSQGFYDPTASNYDYSNYNSNTDGGGADYQAPSGQFGDMQFNSANNADNDDFANEPPLSMPKTVLLINLENMIFSLSMDQRQIIWRRVVLFFEREIYH